MSETGMKSDKHEVSTLSCINRFLLNHFNCSRIAINPSTDKCLSSLGKTSINVIPTRSAQDALRSELDTLENLPCHLSLICELADVV